MSLRFTEAELTATLQSEWYYSIELLPERLTRGRGFANVALTRHLLRRCGVAGQRCLDVGTMEGLVPVLLCRRGAKEVVAIDALNLSHRVSMVQAAYGTTFEYSANINSGNLYEFLLNRSMLNAVTGEAAPFGFDVVVLSGVLYHVFSPLHVLGAARSCLREGGLLILETAAVKSPTYELRYNFTGDRYIYGWTDTWFPTLNLLDYLCRFVKLAPLDCLYLGPSDPSCPDIIRIGVVCRAVSGFLHEPTERLMEESARNLEYYAVVKSQIPRRSGEPDVVYDMGSRTIARHPVVNTCDLLSAVNETAPLDYSREDIVLRLGHTC